MSAKNRDNKNRWRNITVGFRVSGMTVEDLTFSEKDTKWSGIKEYKKY